MASSGQNLEVYVKAATGDATKLGDCPFSQRVLMTCELKGLLYDVKYVDLDKKPDWFLKISPEGRVPLIKINGKYIPDSDVIVEVLEKEFPCPPLSTDPKITCRSVLRIPQNLIVLSVRSSELTYLLKVVISHVIL
ncbi:hypothetical protein M758_3G265400 [Ceratodon purpureus]|nr:hypothetical protein M758_3G265400 [Ceratodon purpureus]